MGIIRRLLSSFSRSRTTTRRRPARTRRPVRRRGSTAGGIMGAIKGFLRGSGKARI